MNSFTVSFVATTAMVALAGCGSVSEMTRQQVARGETSVQQAQTTIGTSEAGAVELQRAKDTLQMAHAALKKEDEKRAQRLAAQAQLDAELAIAKAQNAQARKAANDVLASVQTLQQEADRIGTTPR